jgi:glycosyltransferase involved in cell wall biosynthesis
VKISVIIPVRNEEQSIAQLLNSLIAQTRKPSEIVITDGGSTDGTVAIIETYAHEPVPIHLIRAGAALPGRGRNLAAAQAVNEWLAFIDAGVQPEATWLERLVAPTQEGHEVGVDVVYGTYEPVVDTLFKRCVAIATVTPPCEFAGQMMRDRSIVSSLMKRTVWEKVGGFPEDLRSAEDLLFMNKIEQGHFHITKAPDALVRWQMQATPWLTFKRFMTYARHNMRAGLWRHWQAAIFKYYGLLLLSALPVFQLGIRWLVVTIGLWVLLLGARAAVAIWRNRACYRGDVIENVLRLLVLVPLIAMLDAATILGTLQWAVNDKMRVSPAAV